MKPIEFEGKVVLKLIPKPENSRVDSVDINLLINDPRVNRSQYLFDGLPNETGTKMLTQCFIQGLVGNIHRAQQMGFWNDAEHLRYIIKELERGFVQLGNVTEGHFGE